MSRIRRTAALGPRPTRIHRGQVLSAPSPYVFGVPSTALPEPYARGWLLSEVGGPGARSAAGVVPRVAAAGASTARWWAVAFSCPVRPVAAGPGRPRRRPVGGAGAQLREGEVLPQMRDGGRGPARSRAQGSRAAATPPPSGAAAGPGPRGGAGGGQGPTRAPRGRADSQHRDD
ncbi:hypothetical protein GCM10009759_09900 [Kitasatospora saccharophila]|uniref:Uncharacterized protein n=1 Tax=Kitasatospora saccharophila TaxID=407973 RepID=A0ABN2WBM9_9ACTN